MSEIHLSYPPYDEQTVADEYTAHGCAGVGNLFGASPILVGDTIEIDGVERRIVAVKVKCGGNVVYSDGTPPPSLPPDYTHVYTESSVEIEFWFEAP